ncbi:MAG: HEAT repeat domain-containing protein, partial [Planctomycetota bacterium]
GVRASAAFALGHIGSKQATKGLAEALRSDKEGQVPEAVVMALMWINDASALPALRAALDEESNRERRQTLDHVIRKIEESAWGEAVDGVSVRLRAERIAWKAGGGAMFKIDLKSDRERQLPSGPAQHDFEVEVDGNWYTHDEKLDIRSFVDPSHVRERDGIHLFLGGQWHRGSGVGVVEDLKPGAHVVRVAYRFRSLPGETNKVLRAVSNPVQIEIVPAKAEEPPWGEAVEGVQMRVRPERQTWYESETPKFLADMRNSGTVECQLGLIQDRWAVELDGVWYSIGALFTGDFRTLLLRPGQQHKDIEFSPKKRSQWNINGKPPKFTPGRHTVRLAYHPSTGDRDTPRRLRIVSNPVEIEILPGESRASEPGEPPWGEAVEGLRMAVEFVPQKDSYSIGGQIGVRLHIQNVSDNTVPIARVTGQTDPGHWIIEDSNGVRVRAGRARWMGPRRINRRVLKAGETAVLEIEPLWILKSGSKGSGHVWAFIDTPGVYTARYKLFLKERQQGDWSGSVESGARKLAIGLAGFGKGAGQGWGQPVDGVKCRLRADKTIWQSGKWPKFRADLRNHGERKLYRSGSPGSWEIELDSVWYRATVGWGGTVGMWPIFPGKEQTDILVPLQKGLKWQSKEGKQLLGFSPGKHTVRVALQLDDADGGPSLLSVVSNPVEIKIERALPGSALSIDEAIKEKAAFAAVCEAVEENVPILSRTVPGVAPTSQVFKVVEVLFGKAEAVGRITLNYKYLYKEPECERAIRKHERVIWIGHTRNMSFHGSLYGLKALPDTPENRQAVKAATSQAAAAWGEAVDGLAVRLQPKGPTSAERVTLALEARNDGASTRSLGGSTHGCWLEVDGEWYWRVISYEVVMRVNLKPGQQRPLALLDLAAGESQTWLGPLTASDRRVPSSPRHEYPMHGKPLELAPGPHTVRLAVPLSRESYAYTNAVEIEILPGETGASEADEPPWSETVDGLAVRLRPKGPTSAERVTLVLEVRNDGASTRSLGGSTHGCWLDVDGKWYWRVLSLEGVMRVNLKPGEQRPLAWLDLAAGESQTWLGPLTASDRRVPSSPRHERRPLHGKPLELAPGPHTVRLAMPVSIERYAYTNAVEIEILPGETGASEADEPPWGQMVEGVQMRVRVERQRWYESETPKFLADMCNNGAVELRIGLTQESWQVELDGVWYRTGCSFSGDFRRLKFDP